MQWFVRFLSYLQIVVVKILKVFYQFRDRSDSPPPLIPPNNNPLLRLSATVLAEKIRDRQISSENLIKAYIERIREVNPILNAVVDDRYEAALNDARICDEKLSSGELTKAHLEVKMPLYGIPFTVKESCSLKGLSHTGCTLVRRGIKATVDGPIVVALKNAGAIPICVTNTPELCCNLDATNLLYGRTVNPYDGKRVAGGSSGGEAALLGAGASLIGIGSDIAGSIRIPALFTGIYGHKPTPGIIPATEHFPFADDPIFKTYLVTGPMTRYMDDLALAVRIMSGQQTRKLRLDEAVDIRKVRVFYSKEADNNLFGTIPVASDITSCIRTAASHLEKCGAEVNSAAIGPMFETVEITLSMFFNMPNIPHLLINPDDPKHECNGFVEGIKSLFSLSQYTKSAIYMKVLKDFKGFMTSSAREYYIRKGHLLREQFINMLGDDGVFLYPTFVSPAPFHGLIALQQTAMTYCLLANVFGFPATQVPMGLNKKGMPIGFQVIAGPNQDRLCLAVAKELDKKFGGWIPPSSS